MPNAAGLGRAAAVLCRSNRQVPSGKAGVLGSGCSYRSMVHVRPGLLFFRALMSQLFVFRLNRTIPNSGTARQIGDIVEAVLPKDSLSHMAS